MKKIIISVFFMFHFVLYGQIFDTICDGRDGHGACCIMEKIPDTVWLKITMPVKFVFLVDFKYDRNMADKNGFVYAHVKKVSTRWVSVYDTLGVSYQFVKNSPKSWVCYDSINPNIAINEMKNSIDVTFDIIKEKFIGCACKVWRNKYSRKEDDYVIRKYHTHPIFYYIITIYGLPKGKM